METKFKIYKVLMSNPEKTFSAHEMADKFKVDARWIYEVLLKLSSQYKNIKCKVINKQPVFYYKRDGD